MHRIVWRIRNDWRGRVDWRGRINQSHDLGNPRLSGFLELAHRGGQVGHELVLAHAGGEPGHDRLSVRPQRSGPFASREQGFKALPHVPCHRGHVSGAGDGQARLCGCRAEVPVAGLLGGGQGCNEFSGPVFLCRQSPEEFCLPAGKCEPGPILRQLQSRTQLGELLDQVLAALLVFGGVARHLGRQAGEVGGGQVVPLGQPEQVLGSPNGPGPVFLRGQNGLAELVVELDVLECGSRNRRVVQEPAPVSGLGPRSGEQHETFLGEPRGLPELVDHLSEVPDGDGSVGVWAESAVLQSPVDLSRKRRELRAGEHQVCLVHVGYPQSSEYQRHGAAYGFVEVRPTVRVGVGRSERLEGATEIGLGERGGGVEPRVVGVPLVEGLLVEAPCGFTEGRAHGSLHVDGGIHRTDGRLPFGEGLTAGDAVLLSQDGRELPGELVALGVHDLPHPLAVTLGEVAGVATPLLRLKHPVDRDEPAQVLHLLAVEKRGQPGEAERVEAVGAHPVEAGVVIGDAVLVVVIEGEVHDHPQRPGRHGGDEVVGYGLGVSDVAEGDFDGAGGSTPYDLRAAGAVLLNRYRLDSEFVDQDRPEPLPAPRVGVFGPGAVEDLVERQLFEGDGDERVGGVGAHGDLGDRGVPFAYRLQRLGGSIAGHHDGELTMVEMREPAGGECLETGHLGRQSREQQRLGQPQPGANTAWLLQVGNCRVLVGELREHRRPELVVPQGTRGPEPRGHCLVGAAALVAFDDVVEHFTDGDDLVDGHGVGEVDEHRLHYLERGSVTLHGGGEVDEGVDEDGAERVGEPEVVFAGAAVLIVGVDLVQQDRLDGGRQVQLVERFLECGCC